MSTPEELRGHESVDPEIFGLGVRIPIFNLKSTQFDPANLIRTFSSNFILVTEVLPNLKFNVSLGMPEGSGFNLSMFRNKNKKLYIEADAGSLVQAGLVKRESGYGGAAWGHYEPFSYTETEAAQAILDRLKCRIYDGESGKVYEAMFDEYELRNRGKISFVNNFYEIELDQDGNVVSSGDRETGLEYSLGNNAGDENTEAEFVLSPV